MSNDNVKENKKDENIEKTNNLITSKDNISILKEKRSITNLKKIINLSYISMACSVSSLILFIIIFNSIAFTAQSWQTLLTGTIISILILVLGNLSSLIINIVNSINILSTNFYNDEINDSKLLWGIFSIILLGWVASLIFGNVSIKKIKEKEWIESLK